jgi:hypothetical protein
MRPITFIALTVVLAGHHTPAQETTTALVSTATNTMPALTKEADE